MWKYLYHTDPVTCQRIYHWYWVTKPLQAATLAIACGQSPLASNPIVLPPIPARIIGPIWPGEGYFPEPIIGAPFFPGGFFPNEIAGFGSPYGGNGFYGGGGAGFPGGGPFITPNSGFEIGNTPQNVSNNLIIPPLSETAYYPVAPNTPNAPIIPEIPIPNGPNTPNSPNTPNTPNTPMTPTPEPNSVYVMIIALLGLFGLKLRQSKDT